MAFIKATERTLEAIRKADELKPEITKNTLLGSYNGSIGQLMPSSNRLQLPEATGFELHGEFCPRLTNDPANFFIIENDLDTFSAQKYSYLYVPRGGSYFIDNPLLCVRKSFTLEQIEALTPFGSLYVYLRVQYNRDTNSWSFIDNEWCYIYTGQMHTSNYLFVQPICMLHKANELSSWTLYYSRFPGSIFVEGVWA